MKTENQTSFTFFSFPIGNYQEKNKIKFVFKKNLIKNFFLSVCADAGLHMHRHINMFTQGEGGRGGEKGREASLHEHMHVRVDVPISMQTLACGCTYVREEPDWRLRRLCGVHVDVFMSVRARSCLRRHGGVCTDVIFLSLGNLITDVTVRLS